MRKGWHAATIHAVFRSVEAFVVRLCLDPLSLAMGDPHGLGGSLPTSKALGASVEAITFGVYLATDKVTRHDDATSSLRVDRGDLLVGAVF